MSGCAEHIHHREYYVKTSAAEFKTHDFSIRTAILTSTRLDRGIPSNWFAALLFSAFFDTVQTTGYPFQLFIKSRYTGNEADTTRIVELHLQRGNGQKVDLLESGEMVIDHHQSPDSSAAGTINLPLDDKLWFQEGEEITVTMSFIPPRSAEVQTFSVVFIGKKKEHRYTFTDILNSA